MYTQNKNKNKQGQHFFKLPGGELRPGENDDEGIKTINHKQKLIN